MFCSLHAKSLAMRCFLFVLLILLLNPVAHAQKPKEILRWINTARLLNKNFYEEIPFEFYHGAIVIKVSVGDSSYRYVFDTGGYTTVTDTIAAINRLKVLTTQQTGSSNLKKIMVNIVRLDSVRIGSLLFTELAAIQIGFDGAPTIQCILNGGLIGRNIINSCIWQLDYARKKIIITDQLEKLPNLSQAIRIPVTLDNKLTPYVKVRINDREENCMLDLGSSTLLSFPHAKAKPYQQQHVIDIEGAGSEGAAGTLVETRKIFPVNSLQLGSLALNNISAYSQTQPDILIGGELVKDYIVTLNFQNKEMYLSPLPTPGIRKGLESFGLGMEYREGKTVVKTIYKDLPADKAGLKPGDEVTAIDDQPLGYANYCDCLDGTARLLAGKSAITLTVMRNGKPQQVPLNKEKVF